MLSKELIVKVQIFMRAIVVLAGSCQLLDSLYISEIT